MNADDIIKAVRDLPSLPAVVNELLATMNQDDIDTHALAAKITLDQALTAKTLRLANSSFYGMPAKVTSIQQAVSVLGFHAIRTLVTACSVTDSFKPAPGNQFDFPAFWRHSIASAVCARVLAPHVRVNPDTAFTAGLLHDLGTLVLATRFPGDYRRVIAHRRQHDCPAAPAQMAVFGIDHASVGSALARHWKFPEAIQAAVADHHHPAETGPATLSTVIYAANILAHALDLSGQEDDQVPPLSLAAWQSLGLGEAAWAAVFAESEQLFETMCQMLTP
ncbi:HDOD domain-containing protein [Duganella sp. BJB488]|uniref:HDOD domain-containing protein n=1 Tax=unclassified Duganella TaxID=2636909 RepID=UPI000E34111E|nr:MULTISPECIES: HDOD domain-containing protein [unclassified Duganella]RFP15116.1 HDOD domain-containing protein [Duganella sp. BJB489]RFP19670.1 HDOD domain-containing protein [Duganella sp. BJB488]RFP38060.1 HDOD domain-containing protein [Duganella sp. BJB480]